MLSAVGLLGATVRCSGCNVGPGGIGVGDLDGGFVSSVTVAAIGGGLGVVCW